MLKVFAIRAPDHLDCVSRQSFAGGARIVCARLRRRHSRHRTAFGAHLFYDAAISLHLKVDIDNVRARELQIRVSVERLRANVA